MERNWVSTSGFSSFYSSNVSSYSVNFTHRYLGNVKLYKSMRQLAVF